MGSFGRCHAFFVHWQGSCIGKHVLHIAECPSSTNGSLSGSFASPRYPSNYPDNKRCTWGITVPDGYRIKLVFLEFYTEARYDSLKIHDGPSSSSTEIASMSGRYSSNPVYSSSGSALWFEFSSDGSNTGKGFHANYTVIQSAGMGVWAYV